MPELVAGSGSGDQASDETSEVEVACSDMWKLSRGENKDLTSVRLIIILLLLTADSLVLDLRSRRNRSEWRNRQPPMMKLMTRTNDLDLRLTLSIYPKAVPLYKPELRRSGLPSMNSEESVTTTCLDSSAAPGAWRSQ
ncbi:hypothetical protein LINPERHAP2_LOCUS20500 [Linum perenne]